jgi:transcriptional regulator with XRE-family HTH domain
MGEIDTNKIKGLLAHELKDKGKRELCRSIGISPASLFNYLDNVGTPSLKTVELLSRYFKKPIAYFIKNDSINNCVELPSDPLLSELVTIYNNLDDYQKNKLMEYARDRQKLSEYNKTHGNDNIVFKKTGHNKCLPTSAYIADPFICMVFSEKKCENIFIFVKRTG